MALAANAPTAKNQVDFSGSWTNDLEHSQMVLAQDGHALTGKYTSPDGQGGSITGPLVGWTDGNIITFTVNWPNPSITAWTGHLVNESVTDAIETLWHLAVPMTDPSDPTKLWTAMLAGSDRFTRMASTTKTESFGEGGTSTGNP
jgi:hypothetical protein